MAPPVDEPSFIEPVPPLLVPPMGVFGVVGGVPCIVPFCIVPVPVAGCFVPFCIVPFCIVPFCIVPDCGIVCGEVPVFMLPVFILPFLSIVPVGGIGCWPFCIEPSPPVRVWFIG